MTAPVVNKILSFGIRLVSKHSANNPIQKFTAERHFPKSVGSNDSGPLQFVFLHPAGMMFNIITRVLVKHMYPVHTFNGTHNSMLHSTEGDDNMHK